MKSGSFLFAAALAASALSPAIAGGASYDRWEQGLRERVNALHVYPQAAPAGASGDVLVSFRIGGDGKPADASIIRSSGYEIFDNAAVRLVSSLGHLGPIPTAGKAIDRVTIKLSYGEAASLADIRRQEKADAAERASNEQQARRLVSSQSKMADKR